MKTFQDPKKIEYFMKVVNIIIIILMAIIFMWQVYNVIRGSWISIVYALLTSMFLVMWIFRYKVMSPQSQAAPDIDKIEKLLEEKNVKV